jgi:hypothetical protein
VSEVKIRERLIAAYREGLGLVAIAVVHDGERTRVVAGPDRAGAMPDKAITLCWCRNADEAARVVSAATWRLRRGSADEGDPNALALAAIARVAKRLNVTWRADQDIAAEAAVVIGSIEREFEQMRASGDLRAVNKSYRDYRLEAAARNERIVPYAQWMRAYRESLVRKTATTLKYL